MVTTKYYVGRWEDADCSEKSAYVCRIHNSATVEMLCQDHPAKPDECKVRNDKLSVCKGFWKLLKTVLGVAMKITFNYI